MSNMGDNASEVIRYKDILKIIFGIYTARCQQIDFFFYLTLKKIYLLTTSLNAKYYL